MYTVLVYNCLMTLLYKLLFVGEGDDFDKMLKILEKANAAVDTLY